MLGDAYTLNYTPLFDEELAEAVRYIACELRNPMAAEKMVADVESAIVERQFAPESFEPVPTTRNREYPYYRIPVGNFVVLYCVIGDVIDIRRFVYEKRNWQMEI